ncbi:hypothetical protein DF050_35255 [Burkholderia cepacia]|nr:hypothetical protein DF050_35255 [Burkholderia cepacia]
MRASDASLTTTSSRYWGSPPAVIHRDRVVTYRQLDERSTRMAIGCSLSLSQKENQRAKQRHAAT